jgi:hypothetical protein
MGFGDKFKDLKKQATDAIAENREKIHDAVEVVSAAANEKTHGKYATKIQRFGEKAGGMVDKVADKGEASTAAPGEPAAAAEPTPASTYTPPTGPPPDFG